MSSTPDWLDLDGEEAVVWTGRPRTWSIARSVAGTVVGTAVVVGVVVALVGGHAAAVAPDMGPAIMSIIPGYVLPAVAGVAVLSGLVKVGWAYLTVANVDYVLTDHNIYEKTGVASEHVTRVGLDRIQRTSQSKDVFGQLFDYGSVGISTAGSSGVEMVVSDLNEPDELRAELRRLLNQIGQNSRTVDPGAGLTTESGERTLRAVVDEARDLRETAAAVEEVLEG